MGVDVGPSLEILSFRGAATGDLPWIARRGWLAVGDALVSLEGENISQVLLIFTESVPRSTQFAPKLQPQPRKVIRPIHRKRRLKDIWYV